MTTSPVFNAVFNMNTVVVVPLVTERWVGLMQIEIPFACPCVVNMADLHRKEVDVVIQVLDEDNNILLTPVTINTSLIDIISN